ncbi:MAG: hypothetical protein M3Q52_06780 [Pseudomonadota bacterium]|nr:hypothetical protein [Pseudomonadota bacterium]
MHIVEASHSFVELMVDDAGTSAQRIRIGLTGLAFAFLLVLLGSVISRSGSQEPTAAEQASANAAGPSEPLADLGVAPGAAETQTNNAAISR